MVEPKTYPTPGDSNQRVFECREGQEIELPETEAIRFEKVAANAALRLKCSAERILCRTTSGVRAGEMVGVLATGERMLEILPKIEEEAYSVRQALVHMIAKTKGFYSDVGDTASMSVQHQNLLDCLVQIHGRQMLAAVRRGIPRRYVQFRDDLPVLMCNPRLDINLLSSCNIVHDGHAECFFSFNTNRNLRV